MLILPSLSTWFQHTAARRRLGITNRPANTSNSSFNTQPPEGGWQVQPSLFTNRRRFQHAAARRRLAGKRRWTASRLWFQHAAARRRLGLITGRLHQAVDVSTRSRPKAAGPHHSGHPIHSLFQHAAARRRLDLACRHPRRFTGFNTQPPEGGWMASRLRPVEQNSFNTQPPEGGWDAGGLMATSKPSFNTQPPEGGWRQKSLERKRQK